MVFVFHVVQYSKTNIHALQYHILNILIAIHTHVILSVYISHVRPMGLEHLPTMIP